MKEERAAAILLMVLGGIFAADGTAPARTVEEDTMPTLSRTSSLPADPAEACGWIRRAGVSPDA